MSRHEGKILYPNFNPVRTESLSMPIEDLQANVVTHLQLAYRNLPFISSGEHKNTHPTERACASIKYATLLYQRTQGIEEYMNMKQTGEEMRMIFFAGYRKIRYYADRTPTVTPPTGVYLQSDGIHVQTGEQNHLTAQQHVMTLWNSQAIEEKNLVLRLAYLSQEDIFNVFLQAVHKDPKIKNFKKTLARKIQNSFTYFSEIDILDGRSFNK